MQYVFYHLILKGLVENKDVNNYVYKSIANVDTIESLCQTSKIKALDDKMKKKKGSDYYFNLVNSMFKDIIRAVSILFFSFINNINIYKIIKLYFKVK